MKIVKQMQNESRVLQGKTRTSNQAGLQQVLQKYAAAQREAVPEEELLQGKFETAQLEGLEDDELLDGNP